MTEERFFAFVRKTMEALVFDGFDDPRASPYSVRGRCSFVPRDIRYMRNEHAVILDHRDPLLTLH
jgi:hypothetical protein